MTKIVFKTAQFPVFSETFVTYQIVAAIEMGYEVAILVNKKNSIDSSAQAGLIRKYDLLNKTFEIKDQRPENKLMVYTEAIKLTAKLYPVKYLKFFNFFKYGKAGISGRLFYDMLIMLPFLDADIFHVQFGVNAQPLLRLKKFKLLKGRILTTFLGYDIHYNENNFDDIKKQYASLFKTGDYFTTITEYIGKQVKLLGCPPDKLGIIPLGIDTDYFTPLPLSNKKTAVEIISTGRLVKWKGHAYGIRAVAELVKRGHTVNYTIIGAGEERENLKKLIKELHLEKTVTLAGARDQQFIRDAMQRSDIFLMTSTHDEEGRRETQGVVTGEAQACGLPVVAFNSGGVPYTMVDGKTGFLVEENDYMDMADKLENLITDTTLRKEMSASARQFVTEHYSLEKSAGKMHKVYQKLLQ